MLLYILSLSYLTDLKSAKNAGELGVVGRSKTGDGVPSLDGRETWSRVSKSFVRGNVDAELTLVTASAGGAVTVGTTKVLVTRGDVVEDLGVLVEDGVKETERTLLPSLDTLIDDTGDKSGDNGRRLRSTTGGSLAAVDNNDTVESVGRDIGVTTAGAVVDSASVGDGAIGGGVRGVTGVVVREVSGEGALLVVGSSVDVAETTTRGESLHGSSLGITGRRPSGKLGSTDGGDVRAAAKGAGDENVLPVAKALSVAAGNARVTRGDEDGSSLETKLHPLVALAL